MNFRNDKQRKAMFANMFSSKSTNRYNGIKFSEDPDTFIFDDDEVEDDIVEEVEESIEEEEVVAEKNKVTNLPDLSGDSPDWSDVDVDDYMDTKREYFANTNYAHPTDIGDDKIRKMVEMFTNPDYIYDSGKNKGRIMLTRVSEELGINPTTVSAYHMDKHRMLADRRKEKYPENKEKWAEARRRSDEKLIEKIGKEEFNADIVKKRYERYDVFPDRYLTMLEYNRNYKDDPEKAATVNEWTKEYRKRPYVKKKIQESSKEYRSRPEVIERSKEYHTEYFNIPENVERRREYIKDYNQRPDIQEKNAIMELTKPMPIKELITLSGDIGLYDSSEERKGPSSIYKRNRRNTPGVDRERILEREQEADGIRSLTRLPNVYDLKKIAKEEGLYSRLP